MRERSTQSLAVLRALDADWLGAGTEAEAVAALERAAARNDRLGALVLGCDGGPALCPTPAALLAHLRNARGKRQRDEAGRILSVLLSHAREEPALVRLIVQALVPGLSGVAARLRWGQGGDWANREEFFGDLVSMTWVVVEQWAGQERPYAVLDLLSAIRCRMRRELLSNRDRAARLSHPDGVDDLERRKADPFGVTPRPESDLDELACLLVEIWLETDEERTKVREEIALLYAHEVLGYPISELEEMFERDRRTLYAMRNRARARLQRAS